MKNNISWKFGIIVALFLIISWHGYATHPLKAEFDKLLQDKQATVGVAVVSDGCKTFTYNNQHHFPLMSVFKFHQALAVLNYLDRKQLPLTTEILIRKADLLPDTYSPLREARPEGGFKMSVGELLRYSVSESDNNACDMSKKNRVAVLLSGLSRWLSRKRSNYWKRRI